MMFIVRERLGPREGNGVYIRAQTGFEGSQEARALDQEVARPKGVWGGVVVYARSRKRAERRPKAVV